MRIIGIDPGTARTGYAIVEIRGRDTHVLDLGCITTEKTQTQAEKLLEIASNVEELIEKWHPDQAAIERLFFSQNVTTAVTVAQARGVILETIARRGIAHSEYLPREIKLSVCGNGGADKKAVQKMVQILCNLKAMPQIDDAADAIAVALCHAQHSAYQQLLRT